MKYILKPFLKVLWSILLTIAATIAMIAYFTFIFVYQSFEFIFYLLWEFKFNRFDFSVFNLRYKIKYDDDELASVFHDKKAADFRKYKYQRWETIYRTPYHYIWGIYNNKYCEYNYDEE